MLWAKMVDQGASQPSLAAKAPEPFAKRPDDLLGRCASGMERLPACHNW
jgi:hypothetical protein